ncbi:DUF2059 domain-containing protein [Rhodobacter sp. 24-YEA-8]|uniref:DUF2059 domain-containing protein n=1 Tax=Rhodobacter sp. 24-YEA-8 TaxID=1884310 RepID=UPI0008963A90|nr:DUF2059 domain-containing protein [Rhodobacter sp. 24-YEA-8]SEB90742.1 hypothetical protein SAMN05519105_1556 [Rhodobacter sp. 24-YEA-8]
MQRNEGRRGLAVRHLDQGAAYPSRSWPHAAAFAALIAVLPMPGADFAALAEGRDGAGTEQAPIDQAPTGQALTDQTGGEDAAAQDATLAALEESLGLGALFGVIAREGHLYGEGLDQGLLGGRGGLRWQASVARIYQPDVLRARFSQAMSEALAGRPEVLADAVAFFSSPTGKAIVAREIAARETLLEPDSKEAAEVAAGKLRDARAPRLRLIRNLIDASDLIEGNVASGLTGSAAFNEALAATLPPEQRLPEADRMAQVWAQEAEIRASTTSWLLTFMTEAYAPLSDAELEQFLAFSKSESGRALNQALFTAYGETFRVVMQELGHEAGQVLRGARI